MLFRIHWFFIGEKVLDLFLNGWALPSFTLGLSMQRGCHVMWCDVTITHHGLFRAVKQRVICSEKLLKKKKLLWATSVFTPCQKVCVDVTSRTFTAEFPNYQQYQTMTKTDSSFRVPYKLNGFDSWSHNQNFPWRRMAEQPNDAKIAS
jgi:hypothetical protein